MQFGRPATMQVRQDVEAKIFDLGLEFEANVDVANKKLVIPPIVAAKDQWSKFANVNTKEKNSMFDDFISALASAYLAINNIGSGDATEVKNVVDVYLSHQQGKTGYGKIIAKNMRNNPPVKELDTTAGLICSTTESQKVVFSQWRAAWRGRVDRVTYQLNPSDTTTRLGNNKTVWDGASETRINLLHPDIRDKVREFINLADKNGLKLRVTSGYRSYSDQTALYNQGRTTGGGIVTNAKAGHSYHNFGLAIDVVPIVDKKAIWDNNSYWNAAAKYGKETGFGWGGDWTSFKDKPHFQMTFGNSTTNLRAIYDSGDLLAGGYVNLNSDVV